MSNSSVNPHTHLKPPVSEQPADRDEAFVVTHPWIRHYEQGVPAHLDIPEQPLTWLLDRTASRYPGRTALIYSGTRLSYAQLAHHAHRFAIALCWSRTPGMTVVYSVRRSQFRLRILLCSNIRAEQRGCPKGRC
jgi:hypothetical protein